MNTETKHKLPFVPAPANLSRYEQALYHDALQSAGFGPGGDNRGNTHGHAAMACWSMCRNIDGSIDRERGRGVDMAAELATLRASNSIKAYQALLDELATLRADKAELLHMLDRCAEHIKASDEDWDLNFYYQGAASLLSKHSTQGSK